MKLVPAAGLATATAALALLALAPAPAAGAAPEPYLAVRSGLRCAQCHINRTGGGGRTDFGSIYAQTRLALRSSAFRGRSLGGLASVGGNLRIRAAGTVSEATPRTAVDVDEASLQLDVRLVPDVLNFYVDERVGPGSAATREAFALLQQLPFDGYLKAGKFFLPYGLRLADDAEYIRERTGFTYATPDQGLELGLEPGAFTFFLAVSNGTQGAAEIDDGKQLVGTAALVYPAFRIGVSAARNRSRDSRRELAGAFAGLRAGRMALLGEIDRIRDTPAAGGKTEQTAAYLEGDVLVVRGLNLKLSYGFLDPNTAIGENARIRMRMGLEIFPVGFLQVAAFYTLLEDIPQATADRDELSITLHAHF